MLPIVDKVLTEAQGRYLTKEEEDTILDQLKELPERLRIARAVSKIENEAAEQAMERMYSEFPEVMRAHKLSREKTHRDYILTIRSCVHAMILGSTDHLDSKLLYWFRTILASFEYAPDYIRSTFSVLEECVLDRLGSKGATAMKPYLARCTQVLSDFPAAAAVA